MIHVIAFAAAGALSGGLLFYLRGDSIGAFALPRWAKVVTAGLLCGGATILSGVWELPLSAWWTACARCQMPAFLPPSWALAGFVALAAGLGLSEGHLGALDAGRVEGTWLRDFCANLLTGMLATIGIALALYATGFWGPALLALGAGAFKAVAYDLGWRWFRSPEKFPSATQFAQTLTGAIGYGGAFGALAWAGG